MVALLYERQRYLWPFCDLNAAAATLVLISVFSKLSLSLIKPFTSSVIFWRSHIPQVFLVWDLWSLSAKKHTGDCWQWFLVAFLVMEFFLISLFIYHYTPPPPVLVSLCPVTCCGLPSDLFLFTLLCFSLWNCSVSTGGFWSSRSFDSKVQFCLSLPQPYGDSPFC